MNPLIEAALRKPVLYARTDELFWSNPHISAQLLRAHLDERNPLASRTSDFIERSVEWIAECAPPTRYGRVLDLGCGPGLYASRLAEKGYSVTGIDVSPASIAFAKESVKSAGGPIEYIEGDYLEVDLGGPYDLVLIAYCDYGALSAEERRLLLDKAREALRPGGALVFDVFTMRHYSSTEANTEWEAAPQGGFWYPDAYLCLEQRSLYPPNVVLDRYIVLSDLGIKSYNVWTTCFDTESLKSEAENASFGVLCFADDLTGSPLSDSSETLAAVLLKQPAK